MKLRSFAFAPAGAEEISRWLRPSSGRCHRFSSNITSTPDGVPEPRFFEKIVALMENVQLQKEGASEKGLEVMDSLRLRRFDLVLMLAILRAQSIEPNHPAQRKRKPDFRIEPRHCLPSFSAIRVV